MQVLLLTNNTKQAEFIQKGLKYENLSCDIFMLTDDCTFMMDKVPLYDGIFLLVNGVLENFLRVLVLDIKKIKDIPVFILSSEETNDREIFVSEGLVEGVFVRPFPFRNISSDMKYEIFIKKERIEKSKFTLRDLELDLERHNVNIKGKHVALRNKEFALLHFLLMNQGKVVSRTTILENVWDRNSDILTNTVDVHISQLRKKIERHTDCKFFHTVPCLGYILE